MLKNKLFGPWKPKNFHSLEHLRYLCIVLSKNQNVTEQNKGLLVETLRSMAEILIWGDQNDSLVFDYFLEKNMLSYFLKFMQQKGGRYQVCVQLLQTLNILFENIKNETSLYYLLSNNHVNSIIVHKFDFSDEEVMAYYISFLKTLSLKLNSHTIHFFYNEHTNDFPLYTEAIKFFNHPESMVRIAVRTLTLNVYKVPDRSMLKFIGDMTAVPYFSNLVWFIGNHILELDLCIRNDADHQSRNRLSDLVAEHLDHLHYVNDILCLKIDPLNDVLTDHLLNRLFIPLYVYSLTKRNRLSRVEDEKPHVSSVVSLFLLSQVFLIVNHKPLVRSLADVIFNCDASIFSGENGIEQKPYVSSNLGFVAPADTLDKLLTNQSRSAGAESSESLRLGSVAISECDEATSAVTSERDLSEPSNSAELEDSEVPVTPKSTVTENVTDEEKARRHNSLSRLTLSDPALQEHYVRAQMRFNAETRPYLDAVFDALDCQENDYTVLFSLCLLYAICCNDGLNPELLDCVLLPPSYYETKFLYNAKLMDKLIRIISYGCQYSSRIRLVTLQMCIALVKLLCVSKDKTANQEAEGGARGGEVDWRCFMQDEHVAAIEAAREESTLLLRNFYKSDEIFVDMFEDEYREIQKQKLNVEYLTMDANLLLPPTGTPLTGIDFYKRLPCGEVERSRRAIHVYFQLRDLSLTQHGTRETHLPLTDKRSCVQVDDVLDLNNSDLIACTVVTKEGVKSRRFLVIDVLQLILVEPDTSKLGWGVAKFVGFLQDIEVSGDKDDSRCLHVTIHRPFLSASASAATQKNPAAQRSLAPLLAAKFVFDDHIRCMAAKQRLTKGRLKCRQRKLHQIGRLLELPTSVIQACLSPATSSKSLVTSSTQQSRQGHSSTSGSRQAQRGCLPSMSQHNGLGLRVSRSGQNTFVTNSKLPGFPITTTSGGARRHDSAAAAEATSARYSSEDGCIQLGEIGMRNSMKTLSSDNQTEPLGSSGVQASASDESGEGGPSQRLSRRRSIGISGERRMSTQPTTEDDAAEGEGVEPVEETSFAEGVEDSRHRRSESTDTRSKTRGKIQTV